MPLGEISLLLTGHTTKLPPAWDSVANHFMQLAESQMSQD